MAVDALRLPELEADQSEHLADDRARLCVERPLERRARLHDPGARVDVVDLVPARRAGHRADDRAQAARRLGERQSGQAALHLQVDVPSRRRGSPHRRTWSGKHRRSDRERRFGDGIQPQFGRDVQRDPAGREVEAVSRQALRLPRRRWGNHPGQRVGRPSAREGPRRRASAIRSTSPGKARSPCGSNSEVQRPGAPRRQPGRAGNRPSRRSTTRRIASPERRRRPRPISVRSSPRRAARSSTSRP